MTRAEWALTVQVVAAVSAAVAALFAWRAARQVRRANEYEWRVKASEHLKLIQRLITDYVDTAHKDVAETFGPQMRLQGELAVAYAPLPKCLELVDRWHGQDMTLQELDRLAPAALEEVRAAHKTVWEGRLSSPERSTYIYTYEGGDE
jgi:hypothetical protein